MGMGGTWDFVGGGVLFALPCGDSGLSLCPTGSEPPREDGASQRADAPDGPVGGGYVPPTEFEEAFMRGGEAVPPTV